MDTLEQVACELCGKEQVRPVFVGRDRLLGLPGQFQVVQCENCGLLYTSPRPGRASLGNYYPPGYGIYAPEGGQAERLALYHRRIARRLNALFTTQAGVNPTVASSTAPSRRVLDIGCGEGAFLAEMAHLGWHATGLEMDRGAAERARTTRGLDVRTTTLEDATIPTGTFDLIAMSHLLEHVPHPRTALQRAREWLKPEGKLFITLPNAGSPERRAFGNCWYPWDLPRHLYHFTPETLRHLLREELFEVDAIGYLAGFYIPQSLRYVMRELASRRADSSRENNGMDNPAVSPASLDEREKGDPAIRESSAREAIKTLVFRTLLAGSSLAGCYVPGEVMEVFASRSNSSS